MTEKENDFTVEQRPYTKIRVLLGYSATDIKNDFDKVYHIKLFYDGFIYIYMYLNRTGKQVKMTIEQEDHCLL